MRQQSLESVVLVKDLRMNHLREDPGVADGLAELEVQGDKDLKVRFYNIEDALDEKSWIAGIISETFGRKVGTSDQRLHSEGVMLAVPPSVQTSLQ